MTDTRFATLGEDLEAVLDAADLDDVDDLGTLFSFLMHRPVEVRGAWDVDEDLPGLEVIISAESFAYGTVFAFPTSILEMARHSAWNIEEIGPYPGAQPFPDDAPALSSLDDDGLMGPLREALGLVRLYHLIDDEEEAEA